VSMHVDDHDFFGLAGSNVYLARHHTNAIDVKIS
jgi:hypothetical protein